MTPAQCARRTARRVWWLTVIAIVWASSSIYFVASAMLRVVRERDRHNAIEHELQIVDAECFQLVDDAGDDLFHLLHDSTSNDQVPQWLLALRREPRTFSAIGADPSVRSASQTLVRAEGVLCELYQRCRLWAQRAEENAALLRDSQSRAASELESLAANIDTAAGKAELALAVHLRDMAGQTAPMESSSRLTTQLVNRATRWRSLRLEQSDLRNNTLQLLLLDSIDSLEDFKDNLIVAHLRRLRQQLAALPDDSADVGSLREQLTRTEVALLGCEFSWDERSQTLRVLAGGLFTAAQERLRLAQRNRVLEREVDPILACVRDAAYQLREATFDLHRLQSLEVSATVRVAGRRVFYATSAGLGMLLLTSVGLPRVMRRHIDQLETAYLTLASQERQLREGESRFRAIFDQSFQFIGLMSCDGILLEANRQALAFAGIDEAEVLGKPFWDTPWWTHSPEQQERLRRAVAEAAQGQFVRFEATHRGPDGDLHHIDFSLKPAYDLEGRVCMLIPEGRDITDRIAAEARTVELLRTVEQHKAALDASAIVAVTDSRGLIVYANDKFCEISGYSREELIGKTHAVINSGSHSAQFWRDVWRTISSGQVWRGEVCNRAKNGSLYWVDTTIVPFTDGSGNITQYVAVRTDITQRKQAERALRHTTERFSLAVRGSSDGLWDWNMQTDSVYYSQRFKELLGYEDDEFANDFLSLQSHLHPDDLQPTHEAIQAHLHSVVPFDVRCRLRLKTGEWRWFRLRGQAVRRPRQAIQRMAGSITDIHDAVATQQQLETYAYELRRSNQELEQFAYIASHDLREPLRMVQSFCGLLKDRYHSQLDGRATKYIDFAVEGAARMQRLVEDLLEFSRVGRCNECNDLVRLNDVVEQALTNLHAAIQESGATIQVSALPCMSGDAGRLCQLFQNLIANAIKFRRSEPLVVRIAARHEPTHWVVSVSDNGIGIDPKHFDRLFVVFQRLHTREEYEGTGIGLALCKRIIELHGGRINVLSNPGQGTTFELELPDEKVLSTVDPSEETLCVPQWIET